MLSKEQNGLHQAFQFLFNRKSKITTSQEEISPFTSRSNSNITINSLLSASPTPTPSTSITFSEKEEPWRLLDDGNIHHDYFFMDRQDLYTMNDIIERFFFDMMMYSRRRVLIFYLLGIHMDLKDLHNGYK